MLVLAGILFCLLGIRISIPYWYRTDALNLVEENQAQILDFIVSAPEPAGNSISSSRQQTVLPLRLHRFNPNNEDSLGLLELGFRPYQVRSVMRYRHKGGQFRELSDLQRMYFMNDSFFEALKPWVDLPEKETRVPPSKEAFKQTQFDLNAVDSVELVSIRGIGAYTASRVIRYRNWLGGFVSMEQLSEIKGLKTEQIDTLRKYGLLQSGTPRQLAINRTTESELQEHPYIRYKAAIIVRYRQQHGPYHSPEDLKKCGVLSDSLVRKLMPYIDWKE